MERAQGDRPRWQVLLSRFASKLSTEKEEKTCYIPQLPVPPVSFCLSAKKKKKNQNQEELGLFLEATD